MSPRHRKKGEKRKREIAAAVIDSLAVEGIEGTSFDSVGKRLGVDRAHIAYHFSTHRSLIEGAIREVAFCAQAITSEYIQAAATPRNQLDATVRAAFDHLIRFPNHAATLALFYHFCTHDPAFARLNEEIRESGVRRLMGVVSAVSASKLSRTRTRLLAQSIQALITGQLLDAMTTGKQNTLKRLEKQTLSGCLTLLGIVES